MRRALICLAVFLMALGVPARAHDHRPPKADLRVGGKVQTGHRYHADWVRRTRDPRFCLATFAIGYPTFPKALPHAPGDSVVVRLHKKAAPLEVEVQRWSAVDDDGHASGTPTPLPWSLRPHLVDGKIRAWDVVVVWPATLDHLYLGVAAYWADQEKCAGEPDLGSQFVAWTFHLKDP